MEAPRPIRAVGWTRAPRATPTRGRGAGRRISSHRASASAGESTTTAGLSPAASGEGASSAPARLVDTLPARRSAATQERSSRPASARARTPESRSAGSPMTRPPTAAASSPSVKVEPLGARGRRRGAVGDGVFFRVGTRVAIVPKRKRASSPRLFEVDWTPAGANPCGICPRDLPKWVSSSGPRPAVSRPARREREPSPPQPGGRPRWC